MSLIQKGRLCAGLGAVLVSASFAVGTGTAHADLPGLVQAQAAGIQIDAASAAIIESVPGGTCLGSPAMAPCPSVTSIVNDQVAAPNDTADPAAQSSASSNASTSDPADILDGGDGSGAPDGDPDNTTVTGSDCLVEAYSPFISAKYNKLNVPQAVAMAKMGCNSGSDTIEASLTTTQNGLTNALVTLNTNTATNADQDLYTRAEFTCTDTTGSVGVTWTTTANGIQYNKQGAIAHTFTTSAHDPLACKF